MPSLVRQNHWLGYVESAPKPMMFTGTSVDETNLGFTVAKLERQSAAVGMSGFELNN
jgi:hypothetical protein